MRKKVQSSELRVLRRAFGVGRSELGIRRLKNAQRSTLNAQRFLLFFLFITLNSQLSTLNFVYAVPYHTITIDGDLSDWASDEIVSADANDSTFDPGTGKNEIQNLYVTWDKENLYLGIEGQSNDNGLMLYLDINPGGGQGQGDLRKVNNWNRRVIFSGSVSLANGATAPFLADYFFASWNGSNGNFYLFSSSNNVTDISGQTSQIVSRASKKPGAEIRVPFNTLYGLGAGKVPGLARIACVSAIAAGDVGGDNINGTPIGFGFLGGDSAPNNLNNVPLTNFTSSTLNNFAVVSMDANGDGVPDNSFANITRLELSRPVMTPNPFAPETTGSARTTTISFLINLPATVKVKIFDLSGKEIRNLKGDAVNFSVSPQKVDVLWDGKDEGGGTVPMGIYIVNVRAESSAGGARENTAVAVIK